MKNHTTVTGLVIAVLLSALPGCDEYGPFEPDEVSYYSYETFDPLLGSECSWLTEGMGCSGSGCTIVGTEGEMELGLNDMGDEIRVDMKGEDSPEWFTMYGPVEGDGFTVSFSEDETMDGVQSSVTVDLTGDDTEGEINGDMLVDVAIAAYGESYTCDIEVRYVAVPTGESDQEMTLGAAPRARMSGIHGSQVLSMLRAL